jgi:MFS transporter, PHS family, inorganic phosphate transporter
LIKFKSYLIFGTLADHFGRRKLYGLEMVIITLMTVLSALSTDLIPGLTVFGTLSICRLFLGIGIGADNLLSIILITEFSNKKNRGALLTFIYVIYK